MCACIVHVFCIYVYLLSPIHRLTPTILFVVPYSYTNSYYLS